MTGHNRPSHCGDPADALSKTLSLTTALRTDRRVRDDRALFFAEGVRNVVRMVAAGVALHTLLYSERLLIAPIARQIVRRQRRRGVRTLRMTPEQFRSLCPGQRASGIAAIAHQRWHPLSSVGQGRGICWIVLETVRNPGNLGTLIRSSQAVGGAGLILVGPSVEPYAPAVVRASMGAVYGQRFVRTDWAKFQRWQSRCRTPIIGASPGAAANLHRFVFPPAPLLMLGEERKGLTSQQRGLCDHLVRIPMEAGADSLNLGVAGSLMLFEVYRQHSAGLSAVDP